MNIAGFLLYRESRIARHTVESRRGNTRVQQGGLGGGGRARKSTGRVVVSASYMLYGNTTVKPV